MAVPLRGGVTRRRTMCLLLTFALLSLLTPTFSFLSPCTSSLHSTFPHTKGFQGWSHGVTAMGKESVVDAARSKDSVPVTPARVFQALLEKKKGMMLGFAGLAASCLATPGNAMQDGGAADGAVPPPSSSVMTVAKVFEAPQSPIDKMPIPVSPNPKDRQRSTPSTPTTTKAEPVGQGQKAPETILDEAEEDTRTAYTNPPASSSRRTKKEDQSQGQQPNKDVGSKLGDWLKSTTPNEEGKVAIADQAADAQKRVTQASEKVRAQAENAWDKVQDDASRVKDKAMGSVAETADKGWEKVKDAGEQIKQQAGKMKQEAMDRPPLAGKDRKGSMGEVPDKAGEAWDKVKSEANKVKDKATDKVVDAGNKIQGSLEKAVDKVKEDVSEASSITENPRPKKKRGPFSRF